MLVPASFDQNPKLLELRTTALFEFICASVCTNSSCPSAVAPEVVAAAAEAEARPLVEAAVEAPAAVAADAEAQAEDMDGADEEAAIVAMAAVEAALEADAVDAMGASSAMDVEAPRPSLHVSLRACVCVQQLSQVECATCRKRRAVWRPPRRHHWRNWIVEEL